MYNRSTLDVKGLPLFLSSACHNEQELHCTMIRTDN